MTLSNLAVITGGYPSPALPTYATFVREVAHAVARQGVRCTVIHPVAIHKSWKNNGFPSRFIERLPGGEEVTVLRPHFFSLSARSGFTRLGRLNPGLVTLWSFAAAVGRTLKRHDLHPDALYGHFLYLAGAAAVRIGRELGIPAFPCIGEGEFWTVAKFGKERSKQDIKSASGFLANSSLLKRMLHDELEVHSDKIEVFPNGIDKQFFFPRNRRLMREKYGFSPDVFITACVGHYYFKKGPARVAKAIRNLQGVGGIFMGHGPLPPEGENIIFNERVPHQIVPDLLSAADIFVLPTLVEGSSNAIVEAMACGLPIVSSRGAFNDELLRDDMSIRVDPLDIDEIRRAIITLRDDPALRRQMSGAALQHSRCFDVNDRARRILAFMEQRL